MAKEMICNICKQKVKVRKVDGWGDPFPVEHQSPDQPDKCHGFFEAGQFVKEGE